MAHHVFLSYVRENAPIIDALATGLARRGVPVWLDREHILPGQRWRDAIREAIRGGALFVACFSREYLSRDVSYMNEELIVAIDELRQRRTSSAWFIPVSIDGSPIPSRTIGAGETLTDLQWVNLSANWSEGVRRIASVAGAATSVSTSEHKPSSVVRTASEMRPTEASERTDAGSRRAVGDIPPLVDAILEYLPDAWIVKCAMCNSSGIKPGYENTNCPSCGGGGSRRVTIPTDADNALHWSVVGCGFCRGRGIKPGYSETACILCDGRGVHAAAFPRRKCAKCKGNGLEPGHSETPCRVATCSGVGSIFVGAIL